MTENSNDKQDQLPGFQPLSQKLPAIKQLSPTNLRVLQAAISIDEEKPQSILYQHTVLCQTCLPYRDPGNDVRLWDRDNGHIALRLKAGEALHPQKGWVEIGLPFGPKPRLILCYLNTQALLTRSPLVEVQDSLTAFVKRVGLDTGGRNIRVVKDQLARLSASDLRFGVPAADGESARTFKGQIVSEFDLWFPKNEHQRVLWPTSVKLSRDYFESLMAHAVPLDERALGALAHSAMAIDIYSWLAQRLHRVHAREDAFIGWASLKAQFGFGYTRIRKFKEVYRVALGQVKNVYPDARFVLDDHGITLRHSPPPIARRLRFKS